MKKFSCFKKIGALILLSVVLIGCGGGGGSGGGGGKDGTIYFAMPSYYEAGGSMYAIPGGKTVNFYTTDISGNETLNADHVFTGITGSGIIKATLPKSLINAKRYIYTAVNINGPFDLRGKKSAELSKAIMNGDILFGQVIDADGEKALVTLINGGTIGNIEFTGKPYGDAVSVIKFTLPNTYFGKAPEGEEDPEYPMPAQKKVKFYTITKEESAKFDESSDQSTKPDVKLIYTGNTSGSNMVELPAELKGQNICFIAIVNITGDFDLQGQTLGAIITAVLEKKILLGKSCEAGTSNIKEYTLKEGKNNIENFIFKGLELAK